MNYLYYREKPNVILLYGGSNAELILKNIFNLRRKVKYYLEKNASPEHSFYIELHVGFEDCVAVSNASDPIANFYYLGLGIDENIVHSYNINALNKIMEQLFWK